MLQGCRVSRLTGRNCRLGGSVSLEHRVQGAGGSRVYDTGMLSLRVCACSSGLDPMPLVGRIYGNSWCCSLVLGGLAPVLVLWRL